MCIQPTKWPTSTSRVLLQSRSRIKLEFTAQRSDRTPAYFPTVTSMKRHDGDEVLANQLTTRNQRRRSVLSFADDRPGRTSNTAFEGRNSVVRASVRKNALLVDLVRQRWGVYWHENGLLMERGEGQMGNVRFTYMPYSDLGFAKTWIEIPTRYPPTTPAVVHQPTGWVGGCPSRSNCLTSNR